MEESTESDSNVEDDPELSSTNDIRYTLFIKITFPYSVLYVPTTYQKHAHSDNCTVHFVCTGLVDYQPFAFHIQG